MSELTREVQIDTLREITKQNQMTVESCITSLTKLKDSKKITESGLKDLINVWRELDALRELFFIRLLNSSKRGDLLV